MAISLTNREQLSFDVFLICLGEEREPFVRGVLLNLEQRGYGVFLPELSGMDSEQRAATVSSGISRSRLNAAIVGPTFLGTVWSASETKALEQVEVQVRHGIGSPESTMTDASAVMVFDACDGVSFIASKIARACGQPRHGAVPWSPNVTLCWRCGTSDLSRGSRMVYARECAACADKSWLDPESPYDPDPFGMGLVPSIHCCRCSAELDSHIRFRNRDVIDRDEQGMKIQGVACACGGQRFTVAWSGGSSQEDEW